MAQGIVVVITGSVALLADTILNFSDALTAVPLWIAFVLGRRRATTTYAFGYGRAPRTSQGIWNTSDCGGSGTASRRKPGVVVGSP